MGRGAYTFHLLLWENYIKATVFWSFLWFNHYISVLFLSKFSGFTENISLKPQSLTIFTLICYKQLKVVDREKIVKIVIDETEI